MFYIRQFRIVKSSTLKVHALEAGGGANDQFAGYFILVTGL
jgi:hypothetical protein